MYSLIEYKHEQPIFFFFLKERRLIDAVDEIRKNIYRRDYDDYFGCYFSSRCYYRCDSWD